MVWTKHLDVYLQYRNVVVEIASDESQKSGPGFRTDFPDAGKALARQVVAIINRND